MKEVDLSKCTAEEQLDSAGAFKFWRLNNPNAALLLKEILFRWRGASAYVRGKRGTWVVWPRERWCEWTGLSRNQLDRALKELAECKLVERERHKFAGREVRTYLRPTALALKYIGKPQDLQKAGLTGNDTIAPISEQTAKHTAANTCKAAGEKTSEKSDYTSLHYNSKKPSTPTTTTGATGPTEQEEGSAGDAFDEFEKIHLAYKAKKQKILDQKYPTKKGPHENFVKHPSDLYPNWLSFSDHVKARLYKKYLTYVENWEKGKKGQSYAKFEDWTDEDDAALLAATEGKNKPPQT